MKHLLKLEPILISNMVKAFLVALVAWGLPITDAQMLAMVGIVAPAIGLLGAFEREAVTPVAKVAEVLEKPQGIVNEVLRGVKL